MHGEDTEGTENFARYVLNIIWGSVGTGGHLSLQVPDRCFYQINKAMLCMALLKIFFGSINLSYRP